jgi:nitrogen fixation/metabolism regulation signal transduction histidine kinase
MAHEVKNPLTPIRLSAERLRLKLSDRIAPREAEVLERATQTIISQVDAMKAMVDAFSQYARAPEAELKPLDVNQVVREVLGLYEAHKLRIRQELAPALPPVRGDQAKLRQVIHNLVQNAEDAVEAEESPSIVVGTEAAAGGVRLRVRDNGCGFPEHILARAFEPYVTTKPRGTGLGLAIVRKIVEEHQGMIEIEKAEPRGTCVSVTLPAAHAA